ncbi:hypothetical protein BDV96DRAFT_593606 [Lophiotrema nucula]|uniref:Extracellular membrane protein CFEM domain-containing protein n=1 Tax=Lophiotrema nucula TaxID=690887 RepID=A0A6A5ZXP0_9PLEO|nr:hypothetical protein BDV96DRAFT_593606 [Lophiotrema nucula]
MRFYDGAVMALVANGVTTAAQAISLANFVPRIENLPQSCQTVYTTQISGCQASDFPTPDKPDQSCSSSCVNGLVKITQDVANGCQNVNVPDDSIIGVFLLGRGIPSLCPGVEVTTVAPSSTTSQAQQQTSTSAEVTSTSEAASSTTSSGGIAVDTTVPTEAATTLATSAAFTPNQPAAPTSVAQSSSSSSSSAKASSTATSQKSNSDSGGGSPFDVQATGASSTLRSLATGTLLGLVGLIFTTL